MLFEHLGLTGKFMTHDDLRMLGLGNLDLMTGVEPDSVRS